MEPADEDLSAIETQLRELAAQDRAHRTEDADLLARLMQQADAACSCPRQRVRIPWLPVSAIAAGVAVLVFMPFWWFGQEPSSVADSAERSSAAGVPIAPVLAVAELAPVVEPLPVSPALGGGASPASYDVLPQVVAVLPSDAVAVFKEEVSSEVVAESGPADGNLGDVVRDVAVAVYSGSAEEETDMDDAVVETGEIPLRSCETETASAPKSLAVAQPASVSPGQMKSCAWGAPQKQSAHYESMNRKAKRTIAPAEHNPTTLPPALKNYATQIRERVNRVQY